MRLREVSVDPVDEIESTICSEEEDIVACKVVNVSSSLQEHQLWNNSNCLHPQGECPHDLSEGELVVDQESERKTGRNEEVMPKRIVVPII